MNCHNCGKYLPNKSIEGADFIRDKTGAWWCMNCLKDIISNKPQIDRLILLSEEPERYRKGLIDTLKWSISEGYCMNPKKPCQANAEKCLKCWLLFLVGETEV